MWTTNLEAEFDPKTVDRILRALSHEYNRSMVNYFRESSECIASLDELADYVATKASSNGVKSSEQVAIHLHHSGLPKIADAGILDYDPRTKTVRRRDHLLLEPSELL